MPEGPAPHMTVRHAGRGLAVDVSGDPDGVPILLMHGTPGSRTGPKPRSIVLYRMGIRLITYDRPGYGGSDRHPKRRVIDAADDVKAIADALGVDRLAVVGRSGGGPHALACAASDQLADRITKVGVLVTLAPPNSAGLDWYRGMGASNLEEHSSDPAALNDALIERAEHTRRDPQSLLDHLEPDLTPADRRVVDDVAIGVQIRASYAEGVRPGAYGWIDDDLAFRSHWGFDPASIKLPVRLWHGAKDAFSPASHARWLAKQMPFAEAVVQEDAGHFSAVEILPTMLRWLATPEPIEVC